MKLPEKSFHLSSADAVLAGGAEGYIKAMKAFPVLKEWEIQIALAANRQGAGIQELRRVTPFRQYLKVESYHLTRPPFTGSFTRLFTESEDIPHLVSIGIFPTIVKWVNQWISMYQTRELPLEEFYQNALQHYLPYSAGRYQPVEGATFRTYAINGLKLRFLQFSQRWQRQQTSPEGFTPTKGKPKEIGRRRNIDSLQRVLPETRSDEFEKPTLVGAPQERTVLDLLDQGAQPISEDDLERVSLYSVVADLARQAGLSTLEGTVIIGLFVDGLTIAEVSFALKKPEVHVREARHRAMERLRHMGEATVTALLAGEVVRRGRTGAT